MLNVASISKIQGGSPLYSNITFQINPGEKVGLVGPNGAGKTTLFRMIIGDDRPDTGSISFAGKMRLSYFSQHVGDMKGSSALEVVMGGDQELAKASKELHLYQTKLELGDYASDDEMSPGPRKF
jgi:ATP-binding cassette subfamily F protein 3